MELIELQNSTSIAALQRQNADLVINVGALNRNFDTIPKDITRIHNTLHAHSEQLERMEANQRECHTTLNALLEMIQGLDERVTQHEDSEHNTDRAPSKAETVRSKTFEFNPARGSTAKPEKVREGPKEAKLKRPSPYEGKRGTEAEDFLIRMEVFFMDYDDYFTDEKKIKATLNNTAKQAATWAKTYLQKILNQEQHEHLRSW